MRKIVWNKVTWYSKLLAAIFFIFVIPVLTFKIGTEYAYTKILLQSFTIQSIPSAQVQSVNTSGVESGIFTHVTTVSPSCETQSACEERIYTGQIVIKAMDGKTVATTKVRKDGNFFALLSPGSYKVSPLSEVAMPSIDPVSVVVEKDSIIKKTIRFEIDQQS